ncbi:MAG TPA: hypothetical protein VKG26_15480, partial [Bacteroidia bacterium]|nr:hypothetical protein [Bacteroidia bacterium]
MNTLALSTQKACNVLINAGLTEDGVLGNESNAAIANLKTKLQTIFTKKNYNWGTGNLIGIRMSDVYTNEFTDYGIIITDNQLIAYPKSTKPGLTYLNHPDNAAGCACLKEGQYHGMWNFVDVYGGWTGDPYMQQAANCTVYREVNHGASINRNAETNTGVFGINFHTWKNFNSNLVQNLSAGCQVMDESVLVGEL